MQIDKHDGSLITNLSFSHLTRGETSAQGSE